MYYATGINRNYVKIGDASHEGMYTAAATDSLGLIYAAGGRDKSGSREGTTLLFGDGGSTWVKQGPGLCAQDMVCSAADKCATLYVATGDGVWVGTRTRDSL
jgi:hypothetical protein